MPFIMLRKVPGRGIRISMLGGREVLVMERRRVSEGIWKTYC
jgi:hypothetical protein